jgi:GTP-binding protein
MGLSFLKHVARTRLLLLVVDLSGDDFLEAPHLLMEELGAYGRNLENRDRILVGNKLDTPDAERRLAQLIERYPHETVIGLSALTGLGIDDFVESLSTLLFERIGL